VALGLTFRVGEDFFLNHERYELESIVSFSECVIVRTKDEKKFRLFDDRAVEVYPEVRLSLGVNGQNHLSRITLEAPKSVEILTGRNYRNQYPEKAITQRPVKT
jgi:hypothetical protein